MLEPEEIVTIMEMIQTAVKSPGAKQWTEQDLLRLYGAMNDAVEGIVDVLKIQNFDLENLCF